MVEQRIKHLIFGRYNQETVLWAVDSALWQDYRKSLKGKSTEIKVKLLEQWLIENSYDTKSRIQVTNYIYALKRAGLIK